MRKHKKFKKKIKNLKIEIEFLRKQISSLSIRLSQVETNSKIYGPISIPPDIDPPRFDITCEEDGHLGVPCTII
jgi:hypothetical protein